MQKSVIVSTIQREKNLYMYVNAVSNNLKIIIIFLPYRVMPSLRPIINELQFLRAVARFFATGGGGTIMIVVEGMSLVGSVGVFSLRKF